MNQLLKREVVQYKNPPITKAEIYIFFSTEKNITEAVIQNVFGKERAAYSHTIPLYKDRASENFVTDVLSDTPQAFLFEDKKNGRTLYIGPNSLGVHKSAPYVDWQELEGEFLRIWNDALDSFEINSINQITTLYRNRIDIPFSSFNPYEYFTSVIDLNESVGTAINEFSMRFIVPITDDFRAIISQKNVEPPSENTSSVRLNIETQKRYTENVQSINLKNEMALIRIEKNRIFEGLLTEKAKELFK